MDFEPSSEEIVYLNNKHDIVLPKNATKMIIRYLDSDRNLIGEAIIALDKQT